ncbi:5-oxoprolinase subunit PxpB [Vibrio sp. JC009]|uniref:5-oxoprolinase subunit PxpB n=1 Tax=Vibrio sp. JC009 TaxID=2912314 RepID=UPI0023B00F0E|nr:5-oxoprolinase subunit PxpB [Vibrio sp. JC009]WED24384.1 5-oxoprolinase subunit PxpB [Vibrio sp. JC009]
MWDKLSIEAVCESSILVRFSDEININLPHYINAVAELIVAQHANSIMNITPSYTTLLIDYLPYRVSEDEFIASVASVLHDVEVNLTALSYNTIVLPVFYDESVAPDLAAVMEARKLSKQDLIALHTGQEYTVCAIGFTPGFAFLANVPEPLATPRLKTPRLSVAKGSLGIADRQTAIYPTQTPGGWNIIGNCPVPLFDPASEKLSPFRIGDKVKFESIDRDYYFELGGELWD